MDPIVRAVTSQHLRSTADGATELLRHLQTTLGSPALTMAEVTALSEACLKLEQAESKIRTVAHSTGAVDSAVSGATGQG
jgi:hypothetical protein